MIVSRTGDTDPPREEVEKALQSWPKNSKGLKLF